MTAPLVFDLISRARPVQEGNLNALTQTISDLIAMGLQRDAQALALQYLILIDTKQ